MTEALPRTFWEPSRGQRVPVLAWREDVPPAALRQLQRVASQPWAVDHIAAMPDVHVAEGVAVGTVFATEHHVVPSALGGDLGCGLAAQRFDLPASALSRRDLEAVLSALGGRIPVGDETHRGEVRPLPDALLAPPLSTHALERARASLGPRHLGTLGGGNHFLELDRDAGGTLWVLVHSGSRGMGAAVAAHHRRAAGEEDLAALDARTPEGERYLQDARWAVAFARANREALLARASEVLSDLAGAAPDPEGAVDIHHNFVALEHHGGRALLVHRKGATPAPEGGLGVIPGSMGTASYLVRGLGNERSFGSSSHGAGRVMTRREARDAIRPAQLEQALRRVVFDRRRAHSLVEEAPAVYRDIAAVLRDQADLVTPIQRLEPLAVLKG